MWIYYLEIKTFNTPNNYLIAEIEALKSLIIKGHVLADKSEIE